MIAPKLTFRSSMGHLSPKYLDKMGDIRLRLIRCKGFGGNDVGLLTQSESAFHSHSTL